MDTRDFFREVTLRICSSLDIDEALSHTFSYFQNILPVDAIGLMHKDLVRAKIYPVAQVERDGVRFFDFDTAREIALMDDYVAYVKENPEHEIAISISNRPDDLPPEVVRCFPQLKTFSIIHLVLNIREHKIGELIIAAKGTDRYTEQDARLIESVKEPIAIAMSNARRYRELVQVKDLLAEDNRALSEDIRRSIDIDVVGADLGLREVMKLVRQIAPSNSPTLLLGETGTGKEVIANAIHRSSPRQKGPLISMQCGATPDTLLDNELFGHEKGAFTGASGGKRGRFERANGGTLFLDEIGELSLEAQVKLLRVLQEKQFERVGGSRTIETDVRVIAATHRDLDAMVREGKFREDLWYRLNVLPIRIPPLRLRREDIPALVTYFVERKAQEMNLLHTPSLDSNTLERLKAYSWPGNVRELQNVVERALILSDGYRLHFPELQPRASQIDTRNNQTMPSVETVVAMDQAVTNHIRSALVHTNGKVAGKGGAAELLEMHPSTLRSRIKKLGI